jgi:hypothetical protein
MTQRPNEISYQLAATPSRGRPKKRTLTSQPPGPPLARITRLMALAIKLGARIAREGLGRQQCRTVPYRRGASGPGIPQPR